MTEFKEGVKKFGRHSPLPLLPKMCSRYIDHLQRVTHDVITVMELLLDIELLSCWASCLCLVFFNDLSLSTNHFLQLSVHDL